MPGEQKPYERVYHDLEFQKYTLEKQRPKKEEMISGNIYLYYRQDGYKNASYHGPCYAFINSQGIVQRGSLRSANETAQQKKLARYIADDKQIDKPAITDISLAIKSTYADLNEQYRFLLADFKEELELRHAYNLDQVQKKHLSQELCDEFKADAENLLKSIYDAVTPDIHNTGMMEQIKHKLSNREDTYSKLQLINEALMRGRMALEVPAGETEMQAYSNNLKEIKNLSKDLLGYGDARMKKIGACLVLFAAFSVGMAFAAPTFGASLFLSAAAAATMASIMTIGMPISGGLMGMIGLGCVISGYEKGPAKGLSHFEETAEEIHNKPSF